MRGPQKAGPLKRYLIRTGIIDELDHPITQWARIRKHFKRSLKK